MRSALMFVSLLLVVISPVSAQCTDADADAYFREAGCGTARDCNDADAGIHPGAAEPCDAFDNDCDGALDEGCDRTCDAPQQLAGDTNLGDIGPADIVWTGSEYGVLGRSYADTYYWMWFQRISSNGQFVGDREILGNGIGVRVVWTGSGYAVAWVVVDVNNQRSWVRLTRLDAMGNLVGGTDVLEGSVNAMDLAWSGSEYGMLYSRFVEVGIGVSARQVDFVRLDADGNVLGVSDTIAETSTNATASLAWSGLEYGVAWKDRDSGDLHFTRLDPAGNRIGGDVPIGSGPVGSQSLVWASGEWSAVWNREGAGAYVSRVSAAGAPALPLPIGSYSPLDVAWTGAEYGIVSSSHFLRLDSGGHPVGVPYPIEGSNLVVRDATGFGYAYLEASGDSWSFARIGCPCTAVDTDADGFTDCGGDCDDLRSHVHPGAEEVCDGVANDCLDPTWPRRAGDYDQDGDALTECGGDCDDAVGAVYPGAAQACDGLNNDCNDAAYPDVPADEADADADGSRVCDDDCDDDNPAAHPGATEVCDPWDNDCDGTVNQDLAGCDGTCDVPLVLATTPSGGGWRPAIASDGAGFLIAFGIGQSPGTGIATRRFGPDGVASGPARAIASGTGARIQPDATWNGSEYAVVWSDQRDGGGSEIYFTRVDAAGIEIGQELRITTAPDNSRWPSIVSVAGGYGLAWTDYRDGQPEIYYARLDAAGAKIGTDVRLTTTVGWDNYEPQLAWSGAEFGLVWYARDAPAPYAVYFTRLDLDGNRLGDELGLAQAERPSIAWSGTEYGIVWDDYGDPPVAVTFTRVDAAGHWIDDDPVAPSTAYGRSDRIAWAGGEYGIVYTSVVDGNPETYLGRVDALGFKIGEDLRLTMSAAENQDPVVAWSGTAYAIIEPNAPFLLVGCGCDTVDRDGDGLVGCAGDCADFDAATFPGAPEICDFRNNDCTDPAWPAPPGPERSDDGDLYSECAGDCDDTRGDVYPLAPQLCDGVNNDCAAPGWPDTQGYETDGDGDGFSPCTGDCRDADPTVRPGAAEACNGIDDDCDGFQDEDELGEDTDGDGVRNVCDNCREAFNTNQADTDADAAGNACDNCVFEANPDQADLDSDQRGDLCDNCAAAWNFAQDDSDADQVGDVCDNCPFERNIGQSDSDDDAEGDYCDLDDGIIYIRFFEPGFVEWQEEEGFAAWNTYRGDLAVLVATGTYTQAPGSNPVADRTCGGTESFTADAPDLGPEQVAFYLVTGVNGAESDLGTDSLGMPRPNANPCP